MSATVSVRMYDNSSRDLVDMIISLVHILTAGKGNQKGPPATVQGPHMGSGHAAKGNLFGLVILLRIDFDMPGTPIRLWMRGQNEANPFKGRKKAAPSKLRKHKEGRRG